MAPDHQFPFVRENRAADKGVLFEDGDCFDDFPDAGRSIDSIVLDKVIEDAIEIIPDFRGQFDA